MVGFQIKNVYKFSGQIISFYNNIEAIRDRIQTAIEILHTTLTINSY